MPIMAITRARAYSPYDDWSVDSRGREVNALGQHKTVGFSPDRAPSRGFGGINEFNIRQNYDGTPKAIDSAAQEARKAGALIDRNGQRMADTWENRGFKTHLSDKNPYAQPAGPVAPVVPSLPPGAPSADNRAFAEKAAPRDLEYRGNPAPSRPVAGRTLDNQDWANKPALKGGGGNAAPAAPAAGGDGEESGEAPPAEETTGGGEGEEGSDGGGGGGGGEPAPQPEPEPENSGLLKVELPTPNRALISPIPPSMGNDNSGQAAPGYQGIADSGWGQSAAESAMQSRPSPQPVSNRVSSNPYQARADNVARAKASGEFDNIRNGYNKGFGDTASWMDANGDISTDQGVLGTINRAKLQPVADEIAARRDFDRGEAPVMLTDPNESPTADEMNPQPRRAVKANPYGTATATYGSKPPTGGTMADNMGRTVPMSPYLREQSEVQDTKFGAMPSSVPLGQDDAEQYRAIARGGKIPRSSKA